MAVVNLDDPSDVAAWNRRAPAPASQPVAAPSGPLTDSQIADIYFGALGSQHLREQDRKMVMRFARAVESEVQKQDEGLIWLMLTALQYHTEQTRPIRRTDDAITAACRRLESKP